MRDYLLSPEHPIGRAKARFFANLGFRRDRWQELQAALQLHAREGEAEPAGRTPFGQKYLVRGIVQGPAGRGAAVQTVWIVPSDEVPRLITAYPG